TVTDQRAGGMPFTITGLLTPSTAAAGPEGFDKHSEKSTPACPSVALARQLGSSGRVALVTRLPVPDVTAEVLAQTSAR
ncbi:MAG TPA: hypothetical protein VL403_10075, partial [Candidatus Kryptonia bacterium]|nr:hypothetical protein [Candidatus Kryptonia bacterium]